MKVVLRIGGSVLVPEDVDRKVVKVIVREVKKVKKEHTLFVVVGGGRTARKYIETARDYTVLEDSLDLLGISASRMNALLLAVCLGDSEVIEEVNDVFKTEKTPVLGGTVPGQTTDTVAASVAEMVGADLMVKVTNVDGIYTADPKKDKNAEKIPKMSFDDLEKFCKKRFEAGLSSVIDPVAAEIIRRNRLKVVVIGREDLEDLLKVIGGTHSGTVIE